MSSSTRFVSTLGPVIERYLTLKEALGRRFDNERAVLRSLDSFLAAATCSLARRIPRGLSSISEVSPSLPIATTDGVVRGLISPGFDASKGAKIGDIDPRGERTACFEISDKARLVGAGVLQAVLSWLNGQSG